MNLSTLFGLAAALSSFAAVDSLQNPPACQEWRECRDEALGAAARGDFERFHDLAWRTVQKGPAHDPDLMYLLARAQSLSGRPHDALVMIGRLADAGVVTDAATSRDFAAIRILEDWPAVRARAEQVWLKAASARTVVPDLHGSRMPARRKRASRATRAAAPIPPPSATASEVGPPVSASPPTHSESPAPLPLPRRLRPRSPSRRPRRQSRR